MVEHRHFSAAPSSVGSNACAFEGLVSTFMDLFKQNSLMLQIHVSLLNRNHKCFRFMTLFWTKITYIKD